MQEEEITDFKYGTIDSIEEQSIPAGSASASSNFVTKGDKVALAGGNFNLGGTVAGQLSSDGTHVMYKRDGTEILVRKRGRKLEIYDDANDIWNESGTDIFPVEAATDELSAVNFDSLAGAQAFFSTENSSIYKIMTANPLDPIDLLSTTHRGRLFISQNRIFMMRRKGANNSSDDTGVYISYIDAQAYTTITAENIGTGTGAQLTFATTLAFKAGFPKRTCFGITVTDGIETFSDDNNGNLVGSLGGTGTINYSTGAISVTFNTAPTNLTAITADYQWEDSTNKGVADFTFTTPTRIAGQGDVFRQDSGGGRGQAIKTFKDHEYCFHERKTWDLILSADDTKATNLPYREKVGIPNWRLCASDGDGIYYIDDTDKNNPVLRWMTISFGSSEVVPKPISKKKSLKGFLFDAGWMLVNDNFVIWAGRSAGSVKNDTVFVYDKTWKSIDTFALFSSNGILYQGSLILGDSLSPNVYVAFNGYDDNGSMLNGSWEMNLWDLKDEGHLKKCKQIWIEGEIQKSQIILVSALTDYGSYAPVGYIRGDGSYVDTKSILLGSSTIGRLSIGGRASGVISAFHYSRRLPLRLDKFSEIKLKFEIAVDAAGVEGLGYFSITKIKFHDIRQKQKKLPSKYRV